MAAADSNDGPRARAGVHEGVRGGSSGRPVASEVSAEVVASRDVSKMRSGGGAAGSTAGARGNPMLTASDAGMAPPRATSASVAVLSAPSVAAMIERGGEAGTLRSVFAERQQLAAARRGTDPSLDASRTAVLQALMSMSSTQAMNPRARHARATARLQPFFEQAGASQRGADLPTDSYTSRPSGAEDGMSPILVRRVSEARSSTLSSDSIPSADARRFSFALEARSMMVKGANAADENRAGASPDNAALGATSVERRKSTSSVNGRALMEAPLPPPKQTIITATASALEATSVDDAWAWAHDLVHQVASAASCDMEARIFERARIDVATTRLPALFGAGLTRGVLAQLQSDAYKSFFHPRSLRAIMDLTSAVLQHALSEPDDIASSGWPTLLSEVLQHYRDNQLMLEAVFATQGVMVAYGSTTVADAAARAGVVAAACVAMRAHASHEDATLSIVTALWSIMQASASARVEFGRCNGVQQLASGVTKCTNATSVLCLLGALACALEGAEPNCRRAAQLRVHEMLLQMLATHAQEIELVTVLATALRNFVGGDEAHATPRKRVALATAASVAVKSREDIRNQEVETEEDDATREGLRGAALRDTDVPSAGVPSYVVGIGKSSWAYRRGIVRTLKQSAPGSALDTMIPARRAALLHTGTGLQVLCAVTRTMLRAGARSAAAPAIAACLRAVDAIVQHSESLTPAVLGDVAVVRLATDALHASITLPEAACAALQLLATLQRFLREFEPAALESIQLYLVSQYPTLLLHVQPDSGMGVTLQDTVLRTFTHMITCGVEAVGLRFPSREQARSLVATCYRVIYRGCDAQDIIQVGIAATLFIVVYERFPRARALLIESHAAMQAAVHLPGPANANRNLMALLQQLLECPEADALSAMDVFAADASIHILLCILAGQL